MAENLNSQCQSPTARRQYGQWWPALLGSVAMLLVYLAKMIGQEWVVSRESNESIALGLLSVCIVGFVAQAIIFRSEFHLFMLALCVAFFCREWHFPGTTKGIYVALSILAIWAVIRKDKLEIIRDNRLNIWVWSTFGVYLLSQLIARRVFRYVYLPEEALLHILLEETVETMAHTMMIITCFIAWRAVAKDKK